MKKILILILFFPLFTNAQWIDNFNDGDFTINPQWKGDDSLFIVNSQKQLQLNDIAPISSPAFLSTAFPIEYANLDSIEWSFYIKIDFAPSSTSFARIYLLSETENLENNPNAYYVQFGLSGSNDSIQLVKKNGTATPTIICTGKKNGIASNVNARIKITRQENGLWKLYTDYTGGNNLQYESSGVDNTIISPNYFGIYAKYAATTSGNYGVKYFFDDFSIQKITPDTSKPFITSIDIITSSQIDLVFNEEIEKQSAENISNYKVDNNINFPYYVYQDNLKPNTVHLLFDKTFQNNTTYTITVNNVKDMLGNIIIPNSYKTFSYYEPIETFKNDIIINEVFPDPSPIIGLPDKEFVEIYNRSSKFISLENWKITDGSSTAVLKKYILQPDSFLILCNISDTTLFKNYGNTMGLVSFPSLNNDEDKLYLKNENNSIIDYVNYNSSWYNNSDKEDGGWTLEKINPHDSCIATNNWSASNNIKGGTPGKINSVFQLTQDITAPTIKKVIATSKNSFTIYFSESLDSIDVSNINNYVFIDTSLKISNIKVFSPDFNAATVYLNSDLDTGTIYLCRVSNIADCHGLSILPNSEFKFGLYRKARPFDIVINEIMADPEPVVGLPNYEYIELYNKLDYPISIDGWKIKAGSSEKEIQYGIIEAKNYIVLCSPQASKLFGTDVNIAEISSFVSIANTEQLLILMDENGNVIHYINFTDEWYKKGIKSDGGWSLEQIDPNNPCGEYNNWSASDNPNGGTPGKLNSISSQNPDNVKSQMIRASLFSNNEIKLYFNESIDTTTFTNIDNFNVDNSIGKPIKLSSFGPDYKCLLLEFANSFEKEKIYQLTVTDKIKDCAGNVIDNSKLIKFAIPDTIEANDIVINEVLTYPFTDGVDFVELYNKSNKILDISKLMISNKDTSDAVLLYNENYLFFPKEYLVFSSADKKVSNFYTSKNPYNFIKVNSFPSISSDNDEVYLINRAGYIIDKMNFDKNMHFPLLIDTKGVSLERINPNRDSDDKSNWHSASSTCGFATPAYQNSQYTEIISDNIDISLEPEVFSPDNDGYNDVITINFNVESPGYTINIEIFDFNGRKVKKLIDNQLIDMQQVFSWDGIDDNNQKSPAGIYVFYIELFDTKGNVKKIRKPFTLAIKIN